MNMHYMHYSSINFSSFFFFHNLCTSCNFIIPFDELFIQNISLEIKLQCKLLKNTYICMYIQKYSFHYATRNYIRGMISMQDFCWKWTIKKKNERKKFNSCVANSNEYKIIRFRLKIYYGIKTQLEFPIQ